MNHSDNSQTTVDTTDYHSQMLKLCICLGDRCMTCLGQETQSIGLGLDLRLVGLDLVYDLGLVIPGLKLYLKLVGFDLGFISLNLGRDLRLFVLELLPGLRLYLRLVGLELALDLGLYLRLVGFDLGLDSRLFGLDCVS